MKILNLVYPDKSEVKFEIQKFPDGQQNIVIDKSYYIIGGVKQAAFQPVLVKSRLNNWLDLELITAAAASLRELGVKEIHLYTPYFVGARSDRKFQEGGNNYIKDVIAPVINSLNFESVTVLDPHSDVLEACIKGFRKESNLELIKFAIYQNIYKNIACDYHSKFILVSPDAGASKKIYKLSEQIGYEGGIITCSKDRDVDGKLTKTVVPLYNEEGRWNNYNNKDFIIIDDICDGGATFVNISKELQRCKQSANIGKIYLIVTHGIFSKGFKELSAYFDGIYSTNSYSDIGDFAGNGLERTYLKQLNVF